MLAQLFGQGIIAMEFARPIIAAYNLGHLLTSVDISDASYIPFQVFQHIYAS